MIGIDLTNIKRFENKSENFSKRILSNDEFLIWKNQKSSLFLATRWAIKEAIFKANNMYYEFNKINIVKNTNNTYKFKDFLISTSREDNYLIALVIERENINENKI